MTPEPSEASGQLHALAEGGLVDHRDAANTAQNIQRGYAPFRRAWAHSSREFLKCFSNKSDLMNGCDAKKIVERLCSIL